MITTAFPGLGVAEFARRFSARGLLYRPRHALPTPSRLPGLVRAVRRVVVLVAVGALVAVATGLGWWE